MRCGRAEITAETQPALGLAPQGQAREYAETRRDFIREEKNVATLALLACELPTFPGTKSVGTRGEAGQGDITGFPCYASGNEHR